MSKKMSLTRKATGLYKSTELNPFLATLHGSSHLIEKVPAKPEVKYVEEKAPLTTKPIPYIGSLAKDIATKSETSTIETAKSAWSTPTPDDIKTSEPETSTPYGRSLISYLAGAARGSGKDIGLDVTSDISPEDYIAGYHSVAPDAVIGVTAAGKPTVLDADYMIAFASPVIDAEGHTTDDIKPESESTTTETPAHTGIGTAIPTDLDLASLTSGWASDYANNMSWETAKDIKSSDNIDYHQMILQASEAGADLETLQQLNAKREEKRSRLADKDIVTTDAFGNVTQALTDEQLQNYINNKGITDTPQPTKNYPTAPVSGMSATDYIRQAYGGEPVGFVNAPFETAAIKPVTEEVIGFFNNPTWATLNLNTAKILGNLQTPGTYGDTYDKNLAIRPAESAPTPTHDFYRRVTGRYIPSINYYKDID